MTTRPPSSRSSSSDDDLVVGTLGRAVGLRGEIEVKILSDDPGRFEPGSVLQTAETHRPLTVARLRTHRNRSIVSFEEVGDRDGAEALRDATLVVPASEARELTEDEFWIADLVGCRVVTEDGDDVGEVVDVRGVGENELLVVAGPEAEHLIPLARDLCPHIDPEGGRIVVRPIPGLLEP